MTWPPVTSKVERKPPIESSAHDMTLRPLRVRREKVTRMICVCADFVLVTYYVRVRVLGMVEGHKKRVFKWGSICIIVRYYGNNGKR
jgi:hypothetical protein